MDDSQKNFRLGLFVVITLFLLFGILFLLGGQSLFKPKVVFETYFDNSVSGLGIGSSVLYRGVPLGQVISIELSDSEYEADIANQNRKSYVIVRSEITGTTEALKDWENNIQSSLAKGLRAQTQLAGITGQQYLSLDYITVEPTDDLKFDWQPKHSYIPSAPSSTGKIIASIQSLLSNLNASEISSIGKNLNKLLEKILDKKLITYAPTWRENGSAYLFANLEIEKLNNTIEPLKTPVSTEIGKIYKSFKCLEYILWQTF